jgi:hypothetical protein
MSTSVPKERAEKLAFVECERCGGSGDHCGDMDCEHNCGRCGGKGKVILLPSIVDAIAAALAEAAEPMRCDVRTDTPSGAGITSACVLHVGHEEPHVWWEHLQAQVAALTRERDEWESRHKEQRYEIVRMRDATEAATRERDEARLAEEHAGEECERLKADKRRCHALLQSLRAQYDDANGTDEEIDLWDDVARELADGCEPGSCTSVCDAEHERLLSLLRRARPAVHELHAQDIGCPDCRECVTCPDDTLTRPDCALLDALDALGDEKEEKR